MKKKLAVAALFFMLVIALIPIGASAAWKTTSKGKIYTTSGGGYYTGWHQISGKWYYFNQSDGIMYTGWKYVAADKKMYYFGTDGAKRTGWTVVGKYTYYLGNDGVRRKGWQTIASGNNKYKYYFNKYGQMLTGFQTIDKTRYYFATNGRLQYGFIRLNGKVYYAFPSSGKLAKSEWVQNTYYFQADYTMATNKLVEGRLVGADGKDTGIVYKRGLIRENGKTYFYKNDGKKATGFVSSSGKKYYCDPAAGGAIKTGGWFTVSGNSYYADNNGVIAVSKFVGKKYVLSTGAMAKGWQTINKNRYYFGADGNYVTGWKTISKAEYYFSDKGVMAAGTWITTNGRKYHVAANGQKQYGVTKVGNYYYYLSKKLDGRMLTGWIVYNGKRYYAAKSSGILCRNRFCSGAYTYYAQADCTMATGLKTINSKIYYFTSPQGRMVKNKMQTVGTTTYYFGADGSAVKNQWKTVNGKTYYFGSDGKMVKNSIQDGYQIGSDGVRGSKVNTSSGWVTINGEKHYYSGGKAATGWKTISGAKYYLDSTGLPMKGRQSIGGKVYYFLATGKLAAGYGTLDAAGNVNGILKIFKVSNEGIITSETTVSGSGKGYQMALEAVKYIGNPYVYGGNDINNGIDCSAFVQYIHSKFGYSISRTTYTQCNEGKAVEAKVKTLKPGDLIFYYGGPDHVAMYIGNGMIVHASNSAAYPSGGIKVSNYVNGTIYGARRIWS